MNLFKSLVFVLSFGVATAQAADIGGITVNGEISFDYNMLSSGNNAAIPFTGFAPNEAYRLNQAQLLLKKETEQVSFLGRLAYTQTTINDGAATKETKNMGTLDQVEIYYKVAPSFSVGFGRFLTTMGYESLLKSENATYGNTIAFQGIIPGYGEGLRAKYVANEYFTGTISTYNRSTYSVFGDDYSATKTTEISATGIVGGFTWFGGYYFGKDASADGTTTTEKTSGSLWASYKFMDNLTFAVTYDSRTSNTGSVGTNWADSTSGIITYGWSINNFALRYEMVRGAMHLQEGLPLVNVYGGANNVNSLTIADKISLSENLKFYVEYRMDQADEEVFVDSDNEATKNASMLTFGALASF